MYNFDELEKKWVAYKKNKYKKVGIVSASIAGASILSALVTYYVLLPKKDIAQQQQQTIVAVAPHVEKNDTLLVQQPIQQSIQQPQQPQQPQMQTTPKEIVIISQNDGADPFRSFEQKTQTIQPVQQPQVIQVVQKKEEPKIAPKIFMETKSTGITEALEDKFSRQPTYATALALSSEYYKDGNYQKSLYWAISANNMDSKNDKSWIMFAKASYKLGKKADAINALENFVKTSASDSAKATLNQIKNNEL
jgi:hypothetical protein